LTHLAAALIRARTELERLGVRWALVGGLALAVRAEPRQTRDVDLAIVVSNDTEAEFLVRELTSRGFRFLEEDAVMEHSPSKRLAVVRLQPPPGDERSAVVDLLFHSSGIEQEVVAAADELEVFPGLQLPVATRGHLIALKVLASRPQDVADADSLLRFANGDDIAQAREALDLIERRGCDRGKDLQGALARRVAGEAEPGK